MNSPKHDRYHRTPLQDGQIVIVADFSDDHGDANQVAIKRYRADSATHWHFTSDNPAHATIELAQSATPYPILGIFVAKLR